MISERIGTRLPLRVDWYCGICPSLIEVQSWHTSIFEESSGNMASIVLERGVVYSVLALERGETPLCLCPQERRGIVASLYYQRGLVPWNALQNCSLFFTKISPSLALISLYHNLNSLPAHG